MLHGSVQIAPNIWWSWAIACIAGTLLAASPAAAQCQYDVTVIQGPDVCGILGPVITIGVGLNENGAVVGRWKCPASEHDEAFVWTPDSGLTTLARPTGVSSAYAADISDDGVIVGTYRVTNVGSRGYVYDNGRFTELPTLTGAGWSQANAINGGRVVGYRSKGDGVVPHNAFLWSAQKGFIDLGVMNGPNSNATGITEAGAIVGWTGSAIHTNNTRAFLWQDGSVTDLGLIPGAVNSVAFGVNNRLDVVGRGTLPRDGGPGLTNHAFLWSRGVMRDIGVLPGFNLSIADDINDNRQIVGFCRVLGGPGEDHAFIWQNGVMTDLNTLVPSELGLVITGAGAINASGSIVGLARSLVTVLLTVAQSRLGDLDGDCRVRVPDLLSLLAAWGPCSPKLDCPADLNNDGTVNQLDLVLLIENWG